MQRHIVQHGAKAPGGKRKLLAWLVMLSLLIGIAEFGEPLELAMRASQFRARAQPVSGQVVVVGIDEKALAAIGPWPWNRARLSVLTQRLASAGAERIFFDVPLPPGEAQGDRAFAQTLSRLPGKIFLAGTMDYRTGAQGGGGQPVLPSPQFARYAETVSTLKWIEYWNGVLRMNYGNRIADFQQRSMASAIARVPGAPGDRFPLDYSYQLSSIPYISAVDAMTRRGNAAIRGKTVLVGLNSKGQGDSYLALGQTSAADVFIIALAAETLISGRPIVLGWFPPWLLALAASGAFIFLRDRRTAGAIAIAGIAALLLGPIFLQYVRIFVDVAPALCLMVAAIVAGGWQRFGARKQSQGTINPVSGLPTVNAILHRDQSDPNVLIAARVSRFTEIVSTLPPDYERVLVEQVVSRLSLGVGALQLLHGDDGNFFWLMPPAQLSSAVDQFKALHLIFRNPIAIMDKSFTVDIAFGVDQELDRPLSHRLASALAAARAASEQGTWWKIHDPSADGAKEWALSLLGELDSAIDNGHIWVAYQPKMELSSERIVGAEALVRWTHATRGPIGPDEFIHVAEKHGRIEKLTAFVLNDATRAAAAAVRQDPQFSVSVNISSVLLTSRGIIDMVRQALSRNHFPAGNLILEVTETAAMAEGRIAIALLEELRDMGVALSIDDYGTGMSTLEYLRSIPATELKIDKQFSMDLSTSPEDQAVMQSTIDLAHALGMKVVAEGIETAEARYLLTQMGCEIGQGYQICRPTDWDAVLEMVCPPLQQAAHG